jgi:hypothetical protein
MIMTSKTTIRKKTKRVAKSTQAGNRKETRGQGAKQSRAPEQTVASPSRTKKQIVLDLLRRDDGATTAEIAQATGWRNHTIRGFISGHVFKQMGLAVESERGENGVRRYQIRP